MSGATGPYDNDCQVARVESSVGVRRLPVVLDLPLLALLDGVHDGLAGLLLGVALDATREVHGKHPDAKAFEVWMLVDPEPFGALQALSGLVLPVQPRHRALEFVSLSRERVEKRGPGAQRTPFLRVGHLGAKLADLTVLVDDERRKERRNDSKYASDHEVQF